MNHDDPNPNLNPFINPELEARIVAWVAGEASPFEIAELTRLIGEKPELEIFKRRIEAVHGLAGEAVRPDKEPLRLSADRRAKLLQAIGAPEEKSAAGNAASIVIPDFTANKKPLQKHRQWLLALAACLTVGLFTLFTFPIFKRSYGNSAPLEFPRSDRKPKEAAVFELVAGSPTDELNSPTEISPAAPSKANNGPVNLKIKAEGRMQPIDSSEIAGKSRAKENEFYNERASARALVEQEKQLISKRRQATESVLTDMSGPVLSSTTASSPVTRHFSQDAVPGAPKTGTFRDIAAADSAGTKQSSFKAGITNGNELSAENQVAFGYYNSSQSVPEKVQAEKPASKIASDSDNEKLVLSPFEITSPRESGYLAANTLAGTRLRTDLKDIAAGIRVAALNLEAKKDAIYLDENKLSGAGSNRSEHSSTVMGPGPKIPADVEQSLNELDRKVPPPAPLEDDRPLPRQKIPPVAAPVEVNASKEPVSTFSLHVSDVSFRLAQAALANNEAIDPARIRPEEFYNAFSYGDPTPALAEKVSCRIEQAAHPFLQQRNLVRISTKVAAAGRDAAQPLHLTVLLDTSGSMEREDRSAIVHRAMETLVSLLGPNDRITLIGFARQPSLLAESLSGDQSKQILDIITHTPAEGGTNLEEALKLGGELARRQFEPAARNRIVVLTDGAANLGNANPAQLATAIEILRQQGIAFDACGVGLEGLDDAMLENLTRKGDGRYYVLNSPEAADAGFAHQLAGAFRPAAENVKLQVRFNPARVGNYRLIGFEQHRLREEDFRNDSVDAAELAAEEAAVAVYQVETLPQGEGELGEVYVRFRDASSGHMVERSWTLSYDPQAPAFDRATPSMQLAGTAALLAEKLRGGQNGDAIKLSELAPVVAKLRSHYANETRVQELVTMFEQLRRQAGE